MVKLWRWKEMHETRAFPGTGVLSVWIEPQVTMQTSVVPAWFEVRGDFITPGRKQSPKV